MPSFDVVSEIDQHELDNAVDQTNRELTTRFDFKGVDAKVTREDQVLLLEADSAFQLDQMLDILHKKMVKRGVDIASLEPGEVEESGRRAKQRLTVRQGIDTPLAKRIVKLVKDSKLKVQASIQGEQVRVSGKNRDDLQAVIQMLREAKLDLPLQYVNFRD
ncbi:YajQ family cyclic di-GMP-binding protein [Ectothiorhodospiraceae bacterium 2226]|nr:YajQ family cyclic di-GMP-binding protein [Ectothiorhodospiraceae bacterium 2226]